MITNISYSQCIFSSLKYHFEKQNAAQASILYTNQFGGQKQVETTLQTANQ